MLGDILFFEKQMSKSVIEQILEGIKAGRKIYEGIYGSAVSNISAETPVTSSSTSVDLQSTGSELCRGDNL